MTKLLLIGLALTLVLALARGIGVSAHEEATSENSLKRTTARALLWHGYTDSYRGRHGRHPYQRNYRDHDDDDDDDDHRGRRVGGGGTRDHGTQPRYRGYPHHRYRDDSYSYSHLSGILRVVVIADGETCLVKVFQHGKTEQEQFGDDSTTTSGFINLYGRGECEEGAVGVAYGFVKADVIAEARRLGEQCESEVLAYVMSKTYDPDPYDGVNVSVGGTVGGEALAMCDK